MSVRPATAQAGKSPIPGIKSRKSGKIPFYLLGLYFVFEYARIHSLVGLGPFRLTLLVSLGLVGFLMADGPVFSDKQTKWYLGFLVLIASGIVMAQNNNAAFRTTMLVLTYFIIHLAVLKYVRSYEMLRKLIFIWILCGVFLCLQGIPLGGELKGSAFFSDNNDFALAMNMFLGLAYFRFMENPRKNMMMLAVTGLFILGILASFSRGGFVGLCVILPLMWLTSSKKILGIILAVGMLFFISAMSSSEYWERMNTITNVDDEKGSIAGRRYNWERGWEMFLDYPIFGVGAGNYPFRIIQYEPEGKLRGKSRGGKQAHSIYFTVLPELGLAGSVCFVMMIFVNFKTLIGIGTKIRARKKTKFIRKRTGNEPPPRVDPQILEMKNRMYHDALGMCAALAGFLASGAFLSVMYYPHFWILSTMAASLGKLGADLRKKEEGLEREGMEAVRKKAYGLAAG